MYCLFVFFASTINPPKIIYDHGYDYPKYVSNAVDFIRAYPEGKVLSDCGPIEKEIKEGKLWKEYLGR